MSKCEHGLTINECYVCMSPKHGEPAKNREWVSLTLDEIWEVYKKHDSLQYMEFARAIEQVLKEKNT